MTEFRVALIAITAAGLVAGSVGCGAGEVEPAEPIQLPAAQAPRGIEDRPANAAVHLTVAPEGNEARYRVRERLVGFELPNDAVGATSGIDGAIVIDAEGRIIPSASVINVDLTALRSNEDRRDGFLQRRTLETAEHPNAVLRPTEFRGLALPLPTSGTHAFELIGDLDVKGVSRPTTWAVEATFHDGMITGSAATAFTFDDFELTQPRVPAVLSVADSIRLEYDFRLTAGE